MTNKAIKVNTLAADSVIMKQSKKIMLAAQSHTIITTYPTTIKQDEKIVLAAQSHTITKENIFIKNTQFRSFPIEDHCVEYLKINPKLYLFAEDKNSAMAKTFIAIDYKTIYLLSNQKKFHLYEYFDNDCKLKLYLDIDIKPYQIPENANREEYFDLIIQKSIDLMIKHLGEYNIINPQIIIQSSCRENKLSGHIIFTKCLIY